MGLDMYLEARKEVYVSDFTDESAGKIKCQLPEELKMFEELWHKTLTHIENYTIGYWRKANHIHKWFVDNCGDGEDECQDMYVSKEDLEKLLEACSEVLADHSKAKQLLPTCSGFFFGGTEYDEWYFEETKRTKEICEAAIKFLEEREKAEDYLWSIHYQASW